MHDAIRTIVPGVVAVRVKDTEQATLVAETMTAMLALIGKCNDVFIRSPVIVYSEPNFETQTNDLSVRVRFQVAAPLHPNAPRWVMINSGNYQERVPPLEDQA